MNIFLFIQTLLANEHLKVDLDFIEMIRHALNKESNLHEISFPNFGIITQFCIICKYKAKLNKIKSDRFNKFIDRVVDLYKNFKTHNENNRLDSKIENLYKEIVFLNLLIQDPYLEFSPSRFEGNNFEDFLKSNLEFLMEFVSGFNLLITYNSNDIDKIKKARKLVSFYFKINEIRKNKVIFREFKEEMKDLFVFDTKQYFNLLEKTCILPSYDELYPNNVSLQQ